MNDGSAPGSTTWRNSVKPRAPSVRPARRQQRREGVDAGDQPVGDRRRGAEDDDEEHGRLGQLEQQDREREPRDRRHRLEAGDERAERGPQHLRPGTPRRPTDHADHHGQREADERAPHVVADAPSRASPFCGLFHERVEHRLGRREHVLGSPAAGHHEPARSPGRCRWRPASARSPTRAGGRGDGGARRPARGRRARRAPRRAVRRLGRRRRAQTWAWRRTSSRSCVGDRRRPARTPRGSRCGGVARCRRRTR